MSFKGSILFVLTILISVATSAQKLNTDSLRLARQQALEATRAEQKRILDSTKQARQHIADSIKLVRQRRNDSLTAIRKYRESKHYKDSVAQARKAHADSIRLAREQYFDSLKAERDRVSDSIKLARKIITDSIRQVQKRRTDSLTAIRKYRESKRYKDSVAIVRQIRLDSIREARKAYNDSVTLARKQAIEEANTARKAEAEKLAAIRKATLDSLKAIRQARADSLAKVRETKQKLQKVQQKTREEKQMLALELKIKNKRKAWSNEKMLKKKWSVPRRALQNTFTRYNYYYNAERKMDEALANMQRGKKDNYDSLLELYPFDPDRDSSKLAADMDSIIQKTSLGIQIHDPRTKWADDLYLLLGQAYYYRGNYEQAAMAFRYIISMNQQRKNKSGSKTKKSTPADRSIVEKDNKSMLDFLKHESVQNEAILWLARTYTEAHREGEAESILDMLDSEQDLPENIKGRLALEKAYLNLGRNNIKDAAPYLETAAKDKHLPNWIRMRAGFISGQLLMKEGLYAEAASNFERVIDLHPSIDMDFYARKYYASALMETGTDQQEAVASLKRLLNDGKYTNYYEQIYYVMGRLAANSNNLTDAETYLEKSVSSSKSTPAQKALSFASLGNIYYSRQDYLSAKTAYDSSAYFANKHTEDSLLLTAMKRAQALDEVIEPYSIIVRQDSLLALAVLTEKEQRHAVRKFIRLLEEQRADSIFRAQNAPPVQDASTSKAGSGNWYFSSTALLQQGATEFKRKWGNRPNVDNWRTAGKKARVAGRDSERKEEEQQQIEVDENGLPTEESLLSFIPQTAEQKEQSAKKIQQAYVDLATAYINAVEDYAAAKRTMDTLDQRYPAHPYKADILYLSYLVALRQNQLDLAKQYSETLRNNHPESKWAKLLAPTEVPTEGLLASANTGVPVSSYYDETYGLMMQRDYTSVLQRSRAGQREYKDPVYHSRFRIMEAIAHAGSGNYQDADSLLTEFIAKHPSDSLRSWADAVLNYIKQAKLAESKKVSDSLVSKIDSLVGNTLKPLPPPANYTYKPLSEHYAIVCFRNMESKTMGLRAGLHDYNIFNYQGESLTDAIEMLAPDFALITIKSFSTAALARSYINSIKKNNLLFREFKPDEYELYIISAENYRKLMADKILAPYAAFYKSGYK